MSEEIAARIRQHALSKPEGLPHAPASTSLVEDAESKLGFKLPPLLQACYGQIGNGGFGPGYGLIGLQGGADSDFGTLVETYQQLKTDQESEENEWQVGLLPFCSWGCNIFSCVDCLNESFPVLKFEDFEVWPQSYDLEQFFGLWIDDVDILSIGDGDEVSIEIINPFTGKTTVAKKRAND